MDGSGRRRVAGEVGAVPRLKDTAGRFQVVGELSPVQQAAAVNAFDQLAGGTVSNTPAVKQNDTDFERLTLFLLGESDRARATGGLNGAVSGVVGRAQATSKGQTCSGLAADMLAEGRDWEAASRSRGLPVSVVVVEVAELQAVAPSSRPLVEADRLLRDPSRGSEDMAVDLMAAPGVQIHRRDAVAVSISTPDRSHLECFCYRFPTPQECDREKLGRSLLQGRGG